MHFDGLITRAARTKSASISATIVSNFSYPVFKLNRPQISLLHEGFFGYELLKAKRTRASKTHIGVNGFRLLLALESHVRNIDCISKLYPT
jgi:hypothetical protein